MIFVQAQFSTQSAEAIASAIGGEVVTVDPLAKDYIDNLDISPKHFHRALQKNEGLMAEVISLKDVWVKYDKLTVLETVNLASLICS